jgi:hypothetical protein
MYCEDDMYFLWFGLVVVGLWSENFSSEPNVIYYSLHRWSITVVVAAC